MRFREILRQPVRVLDRPEWRGTLEDISIHLSSARVRALVVRSGTCRWRVPGSMVQESGPKAILLRSLRPSPGESAPRDDQARLASILLGVWVVDGSGAMLGTLRDIEFDHQLTAVTGYLIEAHLWDRLLRRWRRLPALAEARVWHHQLILPHLHLATSGTA